MRFVNVNGVLQKARRYVSGGGAVQEEEVKSPAKLAEILRQLQRRMADVEALTPPEPIEFEVNVAGGGAITSILHGFNSAVRWFVVQWTQVGGTAGPIRGPQLVQDASSTSTTLSLRSYVPGKAIVRVEPAFADVDPGITVSASNMAPKFAALAADVTCGGAGAYVDLMSTTVTTAAEASNLVIQFSASFVKITAAGIVYFIVLVDGVQVGDGTYVSAALNAAGNATLQVQQAVAAGDHTVLVRWANFAVDASINPATNANHFASLFIQEIA